MSRSTLTSINKEHLDNILDRIKTVEWRKKPLPLGKHYGYETKNKGGCGKVTGEFEIVENIKVDLFDIVCNDPKDLVKKGCVDWGFLNKYAGKQDFLYANVIEKAKRYDKPKDLSEFKKENRCYKKGDLDNIGCWERGCYMQEQGWCDGRFSKITRPPQSWCYVEDIQNG